jgi:hemoglobin
LDISLFHKYGGIETISTLVHDSYDDILLEPMLAPLFGKVDMAKLLDHQVKFFSHVLGGPSDYEGRTLESAHRGLSIKDAQFQKVVDILKANLEDLGVENNDVEAVLDIVRSVKGKIVEHV